MLFVVVKNQDFIRANGILNSLGLRTPLRKIPLVGRILFEGY